MKKIIIILSILFLSIIVQSCCVTANCPGVSQIDLEKNSSNS